MVTIQSLLCMVLKFQCNAQTGDNWKTAKQGHYKATEASRSIFAKSTQDYGYWANDLLNDRHFVKQLDTILIPRVVGTANHTFVRKHIVNQMENLGWTVETEGFQNNRAPRGFRDKVFTNVIATLNPNAPRRMVFACHYDSKIDPVGFVAATDSAVPCAQMINIAKTMKRELEFSSNSEAAKDLTLQFLFFDGEEAFVKWTKTDSIYGSRNLAENWDTTRFEHQGVSGTALDRIDIFVLLDLIGAPNMEIRHLERTTSDWFNRLDKIEDELLSRRLMFGDKIFRKGYFPAGIEDDHIPFKTRGVPILHLIAYPFPPEWHKIGDNRNNLDFKKISRLNKILRVFVAEYLHLL